MGKNAKNPDRVRLDSVSKRLEAAALRLERSRIRELSELSLSSKHLYKRAFLYGLARGVGMAVGFTVLGAVAVYALRLIAESRLPYIAELISKIIDIIENKHM